MESYKARWLRIVAVQLEVNDFVSLHLQVGRHHLRQVAQVSLLKVESIVGNLLDIRSKEVVDDRSCQDRLQICLFVELEFLIRTTIEVNGEGGNFHEWSSRIPVLWHKLIALFNDDFAGQRKISIEPGSPEAAAVRHNVKLIAVKLLDLASGRDLQHRTVGVATNNLEGLHGLFLALVSSKESYNC